MKTVGVDIQKDGAEVEVMDHETDEAICAHVDELDELLEDEESMELIENESLHHKLSMGAKSLLSQCKKDKASKYISGNYS